jgi:hypothetical protein
MRALGRWGGGRHERFRSVVAAAPTVADACPSLANVRSFHGTASTSFSGTATGSDSNSRTVSVSLNRAASGLQLNLPKVGPGPVGTALLYAGDGQ